MSTKRQHGRSQLFLVRLWPEGEREGSTYWAGQVQHPVTGEAHPFHGCPQLIEVLLAMMSHQPGTRDQDVMRDA
jgi:hypothetical protein